MIRFHSYWRATGPYRVRIALNLKGLPYETVPHDLRIGAQSAPDYAALNPQHLVPALETGESTVLTQSLAILEWLDERFPDPPLLPAGAEARAIARSMAQVVACDIHPLNNLRVLKALRAEAGFDQPALDRWAQRWIGDGFAALETLIERHGGTFSCGDSPTIADCCLVPGVYSAQRFNVDLAPFPRIMAVHAACAGLAAFADAHPDRQPDAD